MPGQIDVIGVRPGRRGPTKPSELPAQPASSQAGQGQSAGLVLAAADRARRALGRKTRRARRFRMADRPPGSRAGAGSGPSGRPHRRCGCGRRTMCRAAALEAGSRASGRLPCHNRPGSSPRRSLHPGHGRGAPDPSFRQAGRCIPRRSGPRRPRDGDRGRPWPDQGHRPGKGCGYSTPGAAPRHRARSGRAPGPGVACAGGPAISVPIWGVCADSGGREEPDAMSEPLLDRPPPVVNVAMLRTIVLPGAIRVVDSRGSVSRAGRAPEDGDSPA